MHEQSRFASLLLTGWQLYNFYSAAVSLNRHSHSHDNFQLESRFFLTLWFFCMRSSLLFSSCYFKFHMITTRLISLSREPRNSWNRYTEHSAASSNIITINRWEHEIEVESFKFIKLEKQLAQHRWWCCGYRNASESAMMEKNSLEKVRKNIIQRQWMDE